MSIKWLQPEIGHIAGADGNCHPVLIHRKLECDGTSSDYVVTDTSVLSIIDGTEEAIDPATYEGGGELHIGQGCPASDTALVYECGLTLNNEGWYTQWWVEDKASTTGVLIDPPEAGMDNQQMNVASAFVSLDPLVHENDTTSTIDGYYAGSAGFLSEIVAPHVGSPSANEQAQYAAEGYLLVPIANETVDVALHYSSSSATTALGGYDKDNLSIWAENVSRIDLTHANDETITFNRSDATYEVGGYWLVYIRAVTADAGGSAAHAIWWDLGNGPEAIPRTNISSRLPELGQTVHTVDTPHTLAEGESFAPCEMPEAATMRVGGIDYETCIASTDGRLLRLSLGDPDAGTMGGELTELNGDPLIDDAVCAAEEPITWRSMCIVGGIDEELSKPLTKYWHIPTEGGGAVPGDALLDVWPNGPDSHPNPPDLETRRVPGLASEIWGLPYYDFWDYVLWSIGVEDQGETWTSPYSGSHTTEPNQILLEANIHAKCDGMMFRFPEVTSNEHGMLWIGANGGEYELVIHHSGTPGTSSGAGTESYYYSPVYSAGLHKLALGLHDPVGIGAATLEVSFDEGETWQLVDSTMLTGPEAKADSCGEICECVLVGISASGQVSTQDGQILDTRGDKYSWCDHGSSSGNDSASQILPICKVVSQQANPKLSYWHVATDGGNATELTDLEATFPTVGKHVNGDADLVTYDFNLFGGISADHDGSTYLPGLDVATGIADGGIIQYANVVHSKGWTIEGPAHVGPDVANQWLWEGSLVIPDDMAGRFRVSLATDDPYGYDVGKAVWLGNTQEDAELVLYAASTVGSHAHVGEVDGNLVQTKLLDPGVYYIAFAASDPSGLGFGTVGAVIDDALVFMPMEYMVGPHATVQCDYARVDADGVATSLDGSVVYDIANDPLVKYSCGTCADSSYSSGGSTTTTGTAEAYIPKERCYNDANGVTITLEVAADGTGEVVKANSSTVFTIGEALTTAQIAALTQVDCPCCGADSTPTTVAYMASKIASDPYQGDMDGIADSDVWDYLQFENEGTDPTIHSTHSLLPDGRPYYNGDSKDSTGTGIELIAANSWGHLQRRRATVRLPATYHGDVDKPITKLEIKDIRANPDAFGGLWMSIDNGMYTLERDKLVKAIGSQGTYEVDPAQLGRHVYMESYLSSEGGAGAFQPRFVITYDNNGVETVVTESMNNYLSGADEELFVGMDTEQFRLNYDTVTGAWTDSAGTAYTQAEVDMFMDLQQVAPTALPIRGTLYIDPATNIAQISAPSGGSGTYSEYSFDGGRTWQATPTLDVSDHSTEIIAMIKDSTGLVSARIGWGAKVYKDTVVWQIDIAGADDDAREHDAPNGWDLEAEVSHWASGVQDGLYTNIQGNVQPGTWNSGRFGYTDLTATDTSGSVDFTFTGADFETGDDLLFAANPYNYRSGKNGDVISVPDITVVDSDGLTVFAGPLDLGADLVALQTGHSVITNWTDNKPSGTWVHNGKDFTVTLHMAFTGRNDGVAGWYGFKNARVAGNASYGVPLTSHYFKRESATEIRWSRANGSLVTKPHTIPADGLLVPQFNLGKSTPALTVDDKITIRYRLDGGAWVDMLDHAGEWNTNKILHLNPYVHHTGIQVTEGQTVEYKIEVDFDTPAHATEKYIRLLQENTKARLFVD